MAPKRKRGELIKAFNALTSSNVRKIKGGTAIFKLNKATKKYGLNRRSRGGFNFRNLLRTGLAAGKKVIKKAAPSVKKIAKGAIKHGTKLGKQVIKIAAENPELVDIAKGIGSQAIGRIPNTTIQLLGQGALESIPGSESNINLGQPAIANIVREQAIKGNKAAVKVVGVPRKRRRARKRGQTVNKKGANSNIWLNNRLQKFL